MKPVQDNQSSIDAIAASLDGRDGIERLDEMALASYKGIKPTTGWELTGFLDSPVARLRILIPPRFPEVPPRIAIYPKLNVLTGPNLEEDGILCLATDNFTREDIPSSMEALVVAAVDLANEILSAEGTERFRDEFQNYWQYWRFHTGEVTWSILPPKHAIGKVVSLACNGRHLIAGSEEEGCQWLVNAGHLKEGGTPKVYQSLLLDTPKAPLPAEYPNTVAKLKSLLPTGSVASLEAFLAKIAESPERRKSAIILRFPAAEGVGYLGVRLCPPNRNKGRASAKTPNGFRPGKASSKVLAMSLTDTHLSGFTPERLDPDWIHGRDANHSINQLQKQRALIIGAGSLGSPIANEFAKSGVGTITIIDPERLEPANTSRHTEGNDQVGQYKGAAIAKRLTRAFPASDIQFLTNESGEGARWQDLYVEGQLNFENYDLIVVATGDWNSESLMADKQLDGTIRAPVLYTWFDRRAMAAHAVLTFREQGCIRCTIDEFGAMILPVIDFPKSMARVKTPACAGAFEPYGSIEAMQGALVAVKLAMECLLGETLSATQRVWVSSRKAITDKGADWNADWEAINGEVGDGEKVIEAKSFPSDTCRACGKSSGAAA